MSAKSSAVRLCSLTLSGWLLSLLNALALALNLSGLFGLCQRNSHPPERPAHLLPVYLNPASRKPVVRQPVQDGEHDRDADALHSLMGGLSSFVMTLIAGTG